MWIGSQRTNPCPLVSWLCGIFCGKYRRLGRFRRLCRFITAVPSINYVWKGTDLAKTSSLIGAALRLLTDNAANQETLKTAHLRRSALRISGTRKLYQRRFAYRSLGTARTLAARSQPDNRRGAHRPYLEYRDGLPLCTGARYGVKPAELPKRLRTSRSTPAALADSKAIPPDILAALSLAEAMRSLHNLQLG